MKAATYVLVIDLSDDVLTQVGKFGQFYLKAGIYVYAGSACRGFDARIRRHLEREKRLHWHIDYLLNSKYATVKTVWAFPEEVTECHIITMLVNRAAARVPVLGFGSSDCPNSCPSHLVRLPRTPSNLFKEIGGWPF